MSNRHGLFIFSMPIIVSLDADTLISELIILNMSNVEKYVSIFNGVDWPTWSSNMTDWLEASSYLDLVKGDDPCPVSFTPSDGQKSQTEIDARELSIANSQF